MEITPTTISLIGFVFTIIGLFIAYNKNKRDINDSENKQRERIVALEVKVSLFWNSLAKDAAKILHTPHPENKRRDELLELFVESKINMSELRELVVILKNIIEDNIREFGERTAASTLLRAIEIQYKM